MSKEHRDKFLFQRINERPKERKRIRGVTEKRTRNVTRTFTMKTESGDVHQVCAKVSNGTLGYKSDNAIARIFQNQSLQKSKISASIFFLI